VRTQHDNRQWDEELNATLSASAQANNLTPLIT
jgi:hypothetical protein